MRPISDATIGKRIAQIRGDRSRPEFARVMNVHKNTLARYEFGETSINAEFFARLLKAGYNINWVITGEGPKLLKDLEPEKYWAQDAGESRGSAEEELDAELLADVLRVLKEVQIRTRKRWLPEKESALAVELYNYINQMETPRPNDRAKFLQLIESIVGGMQDAEEGATTGDDSTPAE